MFFAGVTKNEREFHARLISAMTGAPEFGVHTYVGTGDGELSGFHLPINYYGSTVDLVCTVANANEAEFSVTVGGVPQASATTNVPYILNGLTFMITMGATPYVVSDAFSVAAQGQATFALEAGDPVVFMQTRAAGVEETLTLTCTTASVATNDAVFSVVGSVSGALAALTQGVAYEEVPIYLTFANGYDVGLGDILVIPLRATATPVNYQWEILRDTREVFTLADDEVAHSQTRQLALKGKGNAGTEEVYIHINREGTLGKNVDWYLNGMTGWDEAKDYSQQMGFKTDGRRAAVTLWSNEIEFFISITGRRMMGAIGNGDLFEHIYMGFVQTHQAPDYYPYPMAIGGSISAYVLNDDLGGLDGHYQSEVALHTAYWNPCVLEHAGDDASTLYMLLDTDLFQWVGSQRVTSSIMTDPNANVTNSNKYVVNPYSTRSLERLRQNFDNTYTPVPVWIASTTSEVHSVFGRFDGLYAISSDGGQQRGNVLVFDGRYHIVFNNVFRQGANDFCAIEVK